MTCPCSQPMPVPGAFPKTAARVTIDRAALRWELGAVAEVREAMNAKATGRPSASRTRPRCMRSIHTARGMAGNRAHSPSSTVAQGPGGSCSRLAMGGWLGMRCLRMRQCGPGTLLEKASASVHAHAAGPAQAWHGQL